MSRENKYHINNHHTNILIINSGEPGSKSSSQHQSFSPSHVRDSTLIRYQASNSNSPYGNRTFLELPSLDDNDEQTHKTPGDISPGRSLDIFSRSESIQPGSKFGLDTSHRRGPSYGSNNLFFKPVFLLTSPS